MIGLVVEIGQKGFSRHMREMSTLKILFSIFSVNQVVLTPSTVGPLFRPNTSKDVFHCFSTSFLPLEVKRKAMF